MDKIIIKDLKLFAYHGVNQEEKINGQPFELDIEAVVNMTNACLSDDINDTVSYAKIVKCIKRVFCDKSYNLLERAAEVVATSILQEFPSIESIIVRLKKPKAPVKADFSYMAVEITRQQA